MRIHFDGVNFSSRSGPNTFGMRLARQLILMGHELELANGQNADVSLVFIEPTGAPLADRVVQRLDGIWSKQGEAGRNARMRGLYERANAVVFQSSFDCGYITQHWGRPKDYTVISNGIEIRKFAIEDVPLGVLSLRKNYNMIFVCSANWHRSKRLKENVDFFLNAKKHHPDSCLIVMGDHPDVEIADTSIFYAGSLDHETCLKIFSVADWMIHLAYFEHCPNTVVEALSQRCPVVCTTTGGTHELVYEYGLVLEESVPFDVTASCDYDNPPPLDTSLEKPLQTREDLKDHEDNIIDIATCAERYVYAMRGK